MPMFNVTTHIPFSSFPSPSGLQVGWKEEELCFWQRSFLLCNNFLVGENSSCKLLALFSWSIWPGVQKSWHPSSSFICEAWIVSDFQTILYLWTPLCKGNGTGRRICEGSLKRDSLGASWIGKPGFKLLGKLLSKVLPSSENGAAQ